MKRLKKVWKNQWVRVLVGLTVYFYIVADPEPDGWVKYLDYAGTFAGSWLIGKCIGAWASEPTTAETAELRGWVDGFGSASSLKGQGLSPSIEKLDPKP